MAHAGFANRVRFFILAIAATFAAFSNDPFVVASATAAAGDTPAAAASDESALGGSPGQLAARVRHAIRAGDFALAQKLSSEVLAKSQLQRWRFHPFSDFIAGIPGKNDLQLESGLNKWIAQQADPAIPLLIRAQYYYRASWFKRGSKFVTETDADKMAVFVDITKKAISDIDASIKHNDRIPYSYYLKLRILQGFGQSVAMGETFKEGIRKYPAYYPLYEMLLSSLTPKWGGSIPTMYAFVDRFAGEAADDSPLKILHLDLYRHLLSTAATACHGNWRDKEKMAQCVTWAMEDSATPALENEISAALELADRSDKHQFSVIVGTILSQMLQTSGADAYSGRILQRSAESMHGETQLEPQASSPRNHVIDIAVSESWFQKGFYENALNKARQALKNVDASTFPNQAEKNTATANAYRQLAKVYNKLNQYAELIAAEEAAIGLDGQRSEEPFICYGHYRLKDFDKAVKSCTGLIDDDSTSLRAYYWRGISHLALEQKDEALRDLTVVADSDNNFRSYAALQISMIYFGRNNNVDALHALNKYTYLYDEQQAGRKNVAASYNNRCYAYMQLGDLAKALTDCRASLQYDSLPDAVRKEQELLKRIKSAEAKR